MNKAETVILTKIRGKRRSGHIKKLFTVLKCSSQSLDLIWLKVCVVQLQPQNITALEKAMPNQSNNYSANLVKTFSVNGNH